MEFDRINNIVMGPLRMSESQVSQAADDEALRRNFDMLPYATTVSLLQISMLRHRFIYGSSMYSIIGSSWKQDIENAAIAHSTYFTWIKQQYLIYRRSLFSVSQFILPPALS